MSRRLLFCKFRSGGKLNAHGDCVRGRLGENAN